MGREPLGTKDLRRLFDGVQRLYRLQEHASFTTNLVDVLSELVPVDVASYDELNPSTKKTFFKIAPHDHPMPENGFEILGQYLHQHPCVAYAHKSGDGRPRKISDFLSLNQWKQPALYNEFYKSFGTRHNLGMQFASGRDRSTIVSMGFHPLFPIGSCSKTVSCRKAHSYRRRLSPWMSSSTVDDCVSDSSRMGRGGW